MSSPFAPHSPPSWAPPQLPPPSAPTRASSPHPLPPPAWPASPAWPWAPPQHSPPSIMPQQPACSPGFNTCAEYRKSGDNPCAQISCAHVHEAGFYCCCCNQSETWLLTLQSWRDEHWPRLRGALASKVDISECRIDREATEFEALKVKICNPKPNDSERSALQASTSLYRDVHAQYGRPWNLTDDDGFVCTVEEARWQRSWAMIVAVLGLDQPIFFIGAACVALTAMASCALNKALHSGSRGQKLHLKTMLGACSFWFNVHFVAQLHYLGDTRYVYAGLSCMLASMSVSLAAAFGLVVYGLRTSLLDVAVMREKARLVPMVTLLSATHIDLVCLLPWTDSRCDGLPQKRLVLICAMMILLAEGPMLAIKARYRIVENGTGDGLITAVFSIAFSVASIFRGIIYKLTVFLTQQLLDRAARRRAELQADASARPSQSGGKAFDSQRAMLQLELSVPHLHQRLSRGKHMAGPSPLGSQASLPSVRKSPRASASVRSAGLGDDSQTPSATPDSSSRQDTFRGRESRADSPRDSGGSRGDSRRGSARDRCNSLPTKSKWPAQQCRRKTMKLSGSSSPWGSASSCSSRIARLRASEFSLRGSSARDGSFSGSEGTSARSGSGGIPPPPSKTQLSGISEKSTPEDSDPSSRSRGSSLFSLLSTPRRAPTSLMGSCASRNIGGDAAPQNRGQPQQQFLYSEPAL